MENNPKLPIKDILDLTWFCPECSQKIKPNLDGIIHYCNGSIKYIDFKDFQEYKIGYRFAEIKTKVIPIDKYVTEYIVNIINNLQKTYNPTNKPFILKDHKDHKDIFDGVSVELSQNDESLFKANKTNSDNINDAYKIFNEFLLEEIILRNPTFKSIISTIQSLK